MTQLTDQMNAAIAELKATQTGVTADQVNAIVTQAVTPLQSSIGDILASEKSDEDKLADVTAALTEFTTAFAPAAPAGDTPAPAPAPEAPAPDAPAPTPAPETPEVDPIG